MKRNLAWLGLSLFVLGAVAPAQGVALRKDAVVHLGSATNTTAPASIDKDKGKEATPEWKTIQSEGGKKGTARYKLLVAEMDKRIRAAVKAVASSGSHDLVVGKGGVENVRGKDVADITTEVIGKLETMAEQVGRLEESLTGEVGLLPSSP